VQAPGSVAIFKSERIDFLSEQTQESSPAVRRGHTGHPDRLSDRLCSVSSGDHIFYTGDAYVRACFAMNKMELPILKVQSSFGIVFDPR